MQTSLHLWLFFLIVFGVVILPGMDMAFVLASSLVGGRRSGFAAVAGIVAGGVCHITMGALGIAAVLKCWPALFNLMLLAGGAYIAWIGWSFLRSNSVFHMQRQQYAPPVAITFRQAMLTSLLNPKAYVFMLAIFPQFLRIGADPIWAQAIALGAITTSTQFGVYGMITMLSSRASHWFATNPGGTNKVARVVGVVLIATAVFTGVQGWQGI